MGLDMYLNRKVYVGAKYEHNKVTGVIDIKKDGKPLKINFNKVSEIVEEAGYWRKANAIHEWFVENVQGGEDDCKEWYVSTEDMQELLKTVNKVLAASELVEGEIQNGSTIKDGKETPNMEKGKYIKDSKVAEELLPTTESFFFGGTNYDQYYYQDLEETKKILEEALKDNEGEYVYRASW